jgi:hypothetical protein
MHFINSKNCTQLAELSALLFHHQVKGISGMKKDVMVAKWKEILDCDRLPRHVMIRVTKMRGG